MLTKHRFTAVMLLLAVCLSVYALVWAQSARGGGGSELTVDTNIDADPPNITDNLCSFREALTASNTDATVDTCEVSGTGSDRIFFNIGSGTPTINVDGVLPNITDSVAIDGNTGGADRIELHGNGGSQGLYIFTGANFSTIRNLVVNGFQTGIYVYGENSVIAGNFIGTNAEGAMAVPNTLYGIDIGVKNATIGGTHGTSNNRCTGDCNLVSGNTDKGIYVFGADNAVVQGNFVGTDVTGKNAIPNGEGINTFGTDSIVGGPANGAGNLISGNSGIGLVIGAKTTVQGNRIGTNRAGTVALPNQGSGIFITNQPPNRGDFTLIGGPDEGDGNLVSGNDPNGIELGDVNHVTFQRDLIGTQINATSPLPNASTGITFGQGANNNTVGGEPAQHNTIAFNQGFGIAVLEAGAVGNRVTANSIYSNGEKGIHLQSGGNNDIAAPVITNGTATGASGTSCAMCVIEVFSDTGNQGRIFEGSVTTNDGNWSFTGSLTGPNITATATSIATNDTSEFSSPFALPVASPTPTPSASPTATPASNLRQGDVNCDGNTDSEDFEIVLDFAVDVSLASVAGACPNVGAAEPVSGHPWGDVTCDGQVNAEDALWLLAHTVGIELPQPGGCTHLGEIITQEASAGL